MNYTELVAAAKVYADRNDIEVADNFDIFIIMAEARINRILRRAGQSRRIHTNTVSNIEFYGLPEDYSGMRSIQFNDLTGITPGFKLLYVTPEQLIDLQNNTSYQYTDNYYTIVADQIQVFPLLAGSGTLELLYYRKVPNINASAPTNWLLSNHPDIYLSGVVTEIEVFVKNYKVAELWDSRVTRGVEELKTADELERWAGNSLSTRAE